MSTQQQRQTGRTLRSVVLPALIELSRGSDITVVAFTMEESVAIARKVVGLAKALGIPCANVRSSGGEGPHVRVRKFNQTVSCPTPLAKVFVDHTAQHEMGCVRAEAVRTVIG